MKRILTIFIILLLCVLCVVGIALLGSGKTGREGTANIDNIQPIKDFFRREFSIGKSSLVIDEKFEGTIDSINGLRIETLTVRASSESVEELKSLQGSIIKRGDVILGGVKAPFTGKVDRVTLQGDEALITVVQYEDMFVSFLLPQKYLRLVDVGDSLVFNCNDVEYEGKVNYISQYIDNGNAVVHLQYNDPEFDLLINSAVSVSINIERYDDVIVIPQSAITLNSNGDTTVRIVNSENEVEIVSVECGKTYDDMVIITSGLSEGMRLIVDMTNDISSTIVDTAAEDDE